MSISGGSHTQPPKPTLDELEGVFRDEFAPYMIAAGIGGFVWDFHSDILYLSPGAQSVFGFAPGQYDGQPETMRSRIVVPHRSPAMREGALGGASDYGAYFKVRALDGSVRWAYAHARYQHYGEGTAVRAVGIVRDADAELGHAAQQATLVYEQSHQLEVLQRVTAELARMLTPEDLADFVTGPTFLDGFNASGAALSLVKGNRRVLIDSTGVPDNLTRDFSVIDIAAHAPDTEAIRTQAPVFVSRATLQEKYPSLWEYMEPSDVTAAIVVPLITQQQSTGCLSLVYSGKDQFGMEDRNLLLTLGSAFSQAVERVRLFDQEHTMSVALQRSMLPTRIPRVAGLDLTARYQPARTGHQVGGDWYDVVTLPDGKVALVVGDVQGHDVQAAAMMGQLRSALRAYITEGHTPSAAIDRASTFLQDQETDLIATCICVLVDPVTGRCQIVRAGHPNPIVRPEHGRSFALQVQGGLPLGVQNSNGSPYPTSDLQLSTDDVLMLCTDGLVESRESDIDRGVLRIKDLLDEEYADLEAMADRLIDAVEQRHGQEDDIVVLLAKLTPTDAVVHGRVRADAPRGPRRR